VILVLTGCVCMCSCTRRGTSTTVSDITTSYLQSGQWFLSWQAVCVCVAVPDEVLPPLWVISPLVTSGVVSDSCPDRLCVCVAVPDEVDNYRELYPLWQAVCVCSCIRRGRQLPRAVPTWELAKRRCSQVNNIWIYNDCIQGCQC